MSNYILQSIPGLIFQVHTYGFLDKKTNLFYSYRNEQYIYIATNRTFLKKLLAFIYLDINTQAKIFSDLVAVDYPTKVNRFHILYHVLGTVYHSRYFIHLWLNEIDKLASIVDLFPSASWFEREVWDLFGVHFYGNPDLRRILTDYGFFGHPFRKDFPLSGYEEVMYDVRLNGIVYAPVSLIQEFRVFDTVSSWDKVNS